MNNKKLSFLLTAFLIPCVFSCSSIMHVASFTASIAGATGLIDENIAESISRSTESIGNAAEVITPEMEYTVGVQVASQLLGEYPLYQNDDASRYLSKILHSLVLHSEKPELYKGYFIGILDSEEINAFATSGGHILVTKGLLRCADSEDAVSAVIAHEISHIQLQHSIKAIKASRNTQATLDTLSATTVVLAKGDKSVTEMSKVLDESVGSIISTLVDSGYSVSQEYDADKNALKLMADAGYDVSAMNDMLSLLEKNSSGKTKGFVKTHPSAKKRMKKLEKEYQKYSVYTPKECRTERFLLYKESLGL